MQRDTDDSDDRPSDGSPPEKGDGALTRRRLVATGAAAWASVGLAGCQYITDPGVDESTDTPAPSPSPTPTATPTVSTETTTTDDPVGGTDTPDGGGDTDDGEETPTETPTPTPTPTPTATATSASCAVAGQFVPGMEIGLHVGVYDSETGEPLGDDAIDSVTVEFPNADYGSLDLNWEGPHERYSAETWGSKIVTGPDTEPGTYRYDVTVSADDTDFETTVSNRFTVVNP